MNRKERRALARAGTRNSTAGAASTESLFDRALEHHRAGRLGDAERAYRGVLAIDPAHADSLHNLGLIGLQTGRHDSAAELVGRAIALKGTDPAYHCHLGISLRALGRAAEAVECYRRALTLAPDHAEALNNMGNALLDLGKREEAAASYRRAIGVRSDYAEAHNNLGNLLLDEGRIEEAVSAYRQAALKPGYVQALYNLGNVLQDLGRLDEAAESYERALAIQPGSIELYNNYGNVLQGQGRLGAAIDHYRQAIALDPGQARPYGNLGTALRLKGDLKEAAASYERALAIDPVHAEAHHNLGNLLRAEGRLTEAAACFARALALKPDYEEAFCELAFVRRMLCDWSSSRADEHRLLALVRGSKGRIPPFILLNIESTPADQLRCASRWIGHLSGSPGAKLAAADPPIGTDGKIRIGYLSADFHRHATAYLMAELLERHDRSRFEIFGYSFGPDDSSDMRRRIIAAFDRFVDIREAAHAEAARRVQADGIDILVDLKGFTQGARPEILTYRPAPLQVNFLGYPGTMGSDLIDYAIVDPFVVPTNQQQFYAEKLVWLPHCYQPNDTQRRAAQATPSRSACGLPEQGLVFCCFNNSYKLTPAFFDIWARLLIAVPDSVLWLLESNAQTRANLQKEASARSIAPERLVFAPRLPLAEHLARHRLADLFLDTLPYNAHTTASDALWMGLPVVTCAGTSFAGRVAGSLLRAVGLPELITETREEYEALALDLARNPGRLAELRRRLVDNRLTAPLFDITGYMQAIEAAFRRMWKIRQAAEPPRSFLVEQTGGLDEAL